VLSLGGPGAEKFLDEQPRADVHGNCSATCDDPGSGNPYVIC
jgi:hypothetical protein